MNHLDPIFDDLNLILNVNANVYPNLYIILNFMYIS